MLWAFRRAVRQALSWWLHKAAWLLGLEHYLLRPPTGHAPPVRPCFHASTDAHTLFLLPHATFLADLSQSYVQHLWMCMRRDRETK